MRLTTRSGLIATSVAVAAIAAPNASAGSGVQASTPGPWGGPMSSGPTIVRGTAGVQASIPTVGGPMSSGPTIVRGTAPSSGFDYGDAAIGAGVIAGLTLLGAAGTLTIRRRIQVEHSH